MTIGETERAMTTIQRNPRNNVDVETLCRIFPDLLPDGREITHAQLEAALSLNRAQSRYRTVVTKWRKLLLAERGVWLDGQIAQGRGFVVLVPDEMVRFGNRGVRAAGRKFRHALAVVSAPKDEQLSEDTRRYRALLEAAIVKITNENRATLRAIGAAATPMRQLPRKAS
jgi:hypothetical protein